MSFFRRLLLVPAFLCIFSYSVFADEIQIVDGSGLTRAYGKIKPGSSARIRVVVRKASPSVESKIVLTQVDGTSGELHPSRESDSVLVFSGVKEGVWRIENTSGDLVLEKVRILAE